MAEVSAPPPPRVFVVDDEEAIVRVVARVLQRAGMEVASFSDPREALAALAREPAAPAALITDLHMSGMTGFELLDGAKRQFPEMPVILMTGKGTVASAVEAMRRGAYDFIVKPIDPLDMLINLLQRAMEHTQLLAANRALRRRLDERERFGDIVGGSAAMREMFSVISSVADTDATVLILGESGTGKELVARAIHAQSQRAGRTFVGVNCGALTESVLESELFGHVKGAFTGAMAGRRGLFEEASGGTLMLDEVGELPAATQVRLLRALQERTIRAVGSDQERSVDVRIIAATHRDLAAAVEAGTFRADLYYRLNVVQVEVPPLRQRPEDVPLLVSHFIAKHGARHGRVIEEIAPDALERLSGYDWPGNVRELENCIERAVVLTRGARLELSALPREVKGESVPSIASRGTDTPLPLADAVLAFERRYLTHVMTLSAGNLSQAATMAGVDRSNFKRLLKRRGIDGD